MISQKQYSCSLSFVLESLFVCFFLVFGNQNNITNLYLYKSAVANLGVTLTSRAILAQRALD